MKFLQILRKPSVWTKIVGIVLLLALYAYLYKLLIPKINAFGCMDDCNNFMGGYFLLHGKQLFSQVFFNHAPFMAHLSEFVQFVTKPQNLHELILRHRQFVLLFDMCSEIILLLRFGLVVLPFALLYEVTKFYLGGDRFLAEGFVVYPLCFMLGILFYKFLKKKTYVIDYLLAAVSFWFVLFMREPYSVVATLLFAAILWGEKEKKIKIISSLFFILLFCTTLFSYNVSEFIYNVITVNKSNLTVENNETGIFGINVYKSFVYPFLIFFQGEWQFIRYIEITLSGIFLFLNGIFLWKKKWQWIIFLWITLGVANLRQVVPGHEYYAAFHLLPWYAMTIFISFLMLKEMWQWYKKLFLLGVSVFVGLILFIFLSKGSYIHDHIDQQTEFITNYGNVMQVGNVVNVLSTPKDTLFLDGFDDTIYFVAHRYSTYQYSWYTSLMPTYKKYTDARIAMFEKNPPDFYYGSCPKEVAPFYLLPSFVKNDYIRLYNLKQPSCLWVKKSKLASISNAQWQKAGEWLYHE